MLKTLIFIGSGILLTLFGQSNAYGQQVVGNNELAAYIGTGGLLLPTTFSGDVSTVKAVADCPECVWAYTIYCQYDAEGLCKHATSTCMPDQLRYRVWFGRTAATAQVVGSVCWGFGRPPTRADVEKYLADQIINYVPRLSISIAPPGGTVTAIAVVGWTNQPQFFTPPVFKLAGREVAISAWANWRWMWGDGKIEWKAVPGTPYPGTQIKHQYREPGLYKLSVTTFWIGSYTVQSLGTYQIGGETLTQTDQIDVQVARANSVLMRK